MIKPEKSATALDIAKNEFMCAVASGDVKAAEKMLGNGMGPNFRWASEHDGITKRNAERSMTPLQIAIMSGNPDMVELLLHHGADADMTMHGLDRMNNAGETALHVAAAHVRQKSNFERIVSILDECGIDVNTLNSRDETPLERAVISLNTGAIEALVETGADCAPAMEALFTGMSKGSLGSRKRKQANAAFSALVGESGFTAYTKCAASNELHQWMKILTGDNRDRVLECMISAHGPSDPLPCGWTLLHHAVSNRIPGIVDALLDRGANPSVLSVREKDSEPSTPLGVLCDGPNWDPVDSAIFRALMDKGAKVDETVYISCLPPEIEDDMRNVRSQSFHDWNRFGNWGFPLYETPLHVAVRNSNLEAVTELINANASINRTTPYGDTALELAFGVARRKPAGRALGVMRLLKDRRDEMDAQEKAAREARKAAA